MSEMELMQCAARWKNRLYRFNINKLGDTPYQEYDTEAGKWLEIKSIPHNTNYSQSAIDNTTFYSESIRNISEINKILIIGFPHSGTTVLRAKMGDCENSIELTNETDFVDAVMSTNIIDQKIIAKTTNVPNTISTKSGFFDKLYHDYHIIAIIKNPYEIFGSLSRRFGGQYINSFDSRDKEIKMRVHQAGFSGDHCNIHSLSTFETFSKFWLKHRDGSDPRYHCIKYEDMFDSNFSCLKRLFSKIKLNYKDDIFSDRKNYYSLQNIPSSEYKKIEKFYIDNNAEPPDSQNNVFRSWQIHKPFVRMSKPESYKDISEGLLERITSSKIIKELGYPKPE